MCHSNNDDSAIRKQIRLAGIQGLQVNSILIAIYFYSFSLKRKYFIHEKLFSSKGVVRKTVSDDLVENIWNMVHMDKIVPSLLYNMQNAR